MKYQSATNDLPFPSHAAQPYDAVFSIGSACGCAFYLRAANLRMMSGPLDWVLGFDGIDNRVAIIEQHFSEWMQEENLTPPEFDPTSQTWNVHDRRHGLIFMHDFHGERPFQEELAEVQARYARRQKRFFEVIRSSRRVLLAWFCNVSATSPQVMEESLLRLRRVWGEHVDLLAVEHDAQLAPAEWRYEERCDGGLMLLHMNLAKDGGPKPKNHVQGDFIPTIQAFFDHFSIPEEKRKAVIRFKRRQWWDRKVRHFLAGFIPNRRLRQKIRRKVY